MGTEDFELFTPQGRKVTVEEIDALNERLANMTTVPVSKDEVSLELINAILAGKYDQYLRRWQVAINRRIASRGYGEWLANIRVGDAEQK